MNLKQILPKNGPPIEEVSKYIEKYHGYEGGPKYDSVQNVVLHP